MTKVTLELFLAAAVSSAAQELEPTEDPLARMTVEDKIGQLLILGFSGTQIEASLKQRLAKFRPGGVIVFSRNISDLYQIGSLNRDAQRAALQINKVPLLIMVDQEGGHVARIKTDPPMPSALAIGTSGIPEIAEHVGQSTGLILKHLGFNMNLAPVFDVASQGRNSFIGNRAFSSNPDHVATMALAFANGLSGVGVLPTAKHFPGHGGLLDDSHRKTPVNLDTLEDLERKDLRAFRDYLKAAKPNALMAAHVAYPNIDSSGLPAAFSKVLIEDYLRGTLGYQGLVITDDIEMLGADRAGSIGERAVLAIEAGCDMVMVAWSLNKQIAVQQALMRAVREGRISHDRLNESVARILNVKRGLKIASEPVHPDEFRKEIRPLMLAMRASTTKVGFSNFERSTRDYPSIPAILPKTSLTVIFSADPRFRDTFARATTTPTKWLRLTPRNVNKIPVVMTQYISAVGVLYVSGHATLKAANSLPRDLRRRMILVNTMHANGLEGREHYLAVINLNGPNTDSGQWLAEWLFDPQSMRIPRTPAKDQDRSSQTINEARLN